MLSVMLSVVIFIIHLHITKEEITILNDNMNDINPFMYYY